MAFLKMVFSAVVIILLIAQVLGAPTKMNKRLSLPLAPSASDIDGAHLLLNNDLDSNTPKNAYMLLSKPRNYSDGIAACVSMGDCGYVYIAGTAGASDLVSLLNNNAPAQAEVSNSSHFWVYNVLPLFNTCLAVNKTSGNTDQIPCSTQLPTVCYNSVERREILVADTSRQIKVDTPVGQVQGWRDQNAFRFLGIPYAKAPVGSLRFAAPVAMAPFSDTWNAINYKGICPQIPRSAGFIPLLESYLENDARQSEDCLNLNVYTPSLKGAGQARLPVMFYIHGGGFTTYSGSVILFEPGNLVSRGGVVVVTINYRLGRLGLSFGNWALHDQILALQWVQHNIASFGGDPNRVTVVGESAGAVSIRALLSARATWGLYQNVIGESDPIDIPFKTLAEATQISGDFMQALNCSVSDLVCARSKSINDVLKAQSAADSLALENEPWTTVGLVERPTIDGDLIPAEFSCLVKTGQYNTKANIMWGTNLNESGLFIPVYFPNPVPIANVSSAFEAVYDADQTATLLSSQYFQLNTSDSDAVRDLLTRVTTAYYFFCPLQYLSLKMALIKPMYNFRFNRGRDIPLLGVSYCSASTGRVCHAAEIQVVFASGDAVPTISQTGKDATFARQVVDRWTTFAKTGNPNPQKGQVGVESTNPDVMDVQWPPYGNNSPILELNVESFVSTNAENDICTFFEKEVLFDFLTQIPGTCS